MAEVTAQEVLQQISQGHLECTICIDRFKQPKILNCLHSFCIECLQQYQSNQHPNCSKLPCPLCRKETMLGDSAIPGLPNNFSLSALVEEFTQQERLVERQKAKITCEVCEEDDAISRCFDCKEYMCWVCEKAHKRAVKTKRHDIMTLEDLRSGKAIFKSRMRDEIPKCNKHSNQDVCFICTTCNVLICSICTALDHSKPEHTYEDIEAAEVSFRDSAKTLLSEAKNSAQKILTAKGFIDEAPAKLQMMIGDAASDISKRANEEVARIWEREKVLKAELAKFEEERSKVLETAQETYSESLKWAEDTLKTVEAIFDQSSRFELLELKKNIVENLEEVKEQHLPSPDQNLASFLVFQPTYGAGIALGKLLLREEWSLKTVFDGNLGSPDDREGFQMAIRIAAFTNGDLAVVDVAADTIRVFNSTGCSKYNLNTHINAAKDKLRSPFDLAATTDNKLVVIDNPMVKIFDTSREQVKFLFSFNPVLEESKDSEIECSLHCIAVDKMNRIAVGDTKRHIISLHELDGKFIKKLPAKFTPHWLAMGNNGQIFFSSTKHGKLVSLGLDGQEIFCVDTVINGTKMKPYGVCCDCNGDIFVTLRNDSIGLGSGEIHVYSSQGSHMRCIAQNFPSPFGLTCTPTGELAVTNVLDVRVYHIV